jgi:rRNA-processing protein FCF1
MTPARIYLETTMFNFPFVDDAPQYRADTRKLFDEIKAGKFEPYTSEYVVQELNNTKEGKRKNDMIQLLTDCGAVILQQGEEIERLAAIYVAEGIIPVAYETDALHIAAATVNRLDFIVSLNFQHIVKQKTIEETEIVNYRVGYKKIGIYIPAEVINYDENP